MQDVLQFKIMDIKWETADCKTFYLYSSEKIIYNAGQFLPFIFNRNGREIRRSYSFSSSPDADDHISITIKQTVNGEMSAWWMNEAIVGSELTSLYPAGKFTIEWSEKPRDIFLVAAGSGITPLFSLLKSALTKEPRSRIHLVYSNSNLRSAIFYEQLESLATQYSQQLDITWLFSDAQQVFDARLGTFSLQRIIEKQLHYKMADALVYTCGPFNFMLMVQITCRSLGVPANNIRRELFDIADTTPADKKYFDTQDRTITIKHKNQEFKLLVPYNQTILNAAAQMDLALPYSCRAGRCSTCICKVLSGEIWMHNNEVLTDEDIANGLALTCTGHPASGNVVIEI